MTGTATLLRQRRRDNARPYGHITKQVMAEDFRFMAESLLPYVADPDAQASALECLDHADRLDQSPRCGWYPRRPKGWRA